MIRKVNYGMGNIIGVCFFVKYCFILIGYLYFYIKYYFYNEYYVWLFISVMNCLAANLAG